MEEINNRQRRKEKTQFSCLIWFLSFNLEPVLLIRQKDVAQDKYINVTSPKIALQKKHCTAFHFLPLSNVRMPGLHVLMGSPFSAYHCIEKRNQTEFCLSLHLQITFSKQLFWRLVVHEGLVWGIAFVSNDMTTLITLENGISPPPLKLCAKVTENSIGKWRRE